MEPPGPISRWFDGVLIIICGLGCFLAFYMIEFHLCAKADCSELKITKIWVSFSELYILYGVGAITTGIYLIREKALIRLYRLAIALSVAMGVLLSTSAVIGVRIELG